MFRRRAYGREHWTSLHGGLVLTSILCLNPILRSYSVHTHILIFFIFYVFFFNIDQYLSLCILPVFLSLQDGGEKRIHNSAILHDILVSSFLLLPTVIHVHAYHLYCDIFCMHAFMWGYEGFLFVILFCVHMRAWHSLGVGVSSSHFLCVLESF